MVFQHDADLRYHVESAAAVCDGFNSESNVLEHMDTTEYTPVSCYIFGMGPVFNDV